MDNAIRREELLGDRDSPVLLYENYRLRLLDAGEVPYVSTLSTLRNTDVIIVDIYTSAKNGYEEFGDASCTETVPEGNVKEFGEESEYGGSPLKFSFLTLSKLQAEEKSRVNINACYGLKKRFAGNPLSYAEAGSVMNRLIFDRWPFEGGSLGNIPVFIMVDGKDARNTVMLGIRKNKDTVTSFSIRYFGAKVVGDDWKQIEQFGSLFQDFQGTYMAYCTYDILAEMPNSEIDSDCRISAFLRLAVRWPCSAEDVLSQPPPHAPVTVVVYPGWLDSRIPYSDWSGELRLILALSRALRTRKLDWSEANTNVEPSEVFDKVKNLLKEESSLKAPEETSGFLDFTDRLWVIMTECRSYNMVVAVLRLVFEALRHGFKNTMIKDDNKSQMARFIRDACNNELMLPRLEGLTPVEIMLGMGLERFKRRCVHEILSHEMVANVKELDTFYDTRSSNSLESSADSMFLLYNSLVILAICKQYLRIGAHKIHLLARRILSQFNQMTLPPVSNGITADLLKDFELKLKFDVTLIDVYPNVFKIKTSKEWFLDAVFQKSKQVVGEGIMYFSREPLLEYCDLNCEGDDVKIVNLDKKFERRVTSTGQNIEDFYPAIILSRTPVVFVKLTRMLCMNDNLYEYETQFFGFSPKAFVDTVHNIIVDIWTSIVQNEIIPRIPTDELDKVQLSNLKRRLVLLICRHNRLEHVMDKLEHHVLTYVFRIPDFLTLPEDLPNLDVNEGLDEEHEINSRIKTLEDKIIELRMAKTMLDDEIRNTKKVLDIIQEFETAAITERNT